MGPKQCLVCNGAVSKYKCPSCLVPYCSLPCFKKHKEIPCSVPTVTCEQSEKSTSAPTQSLEEGLTNVDESSMVLKRSQREPISSSPTQSLIERPINVEESSMALDRSQLEAIACSSEIRDALKDENLRKLICDIDFSDDVEIELVKAIGLEEFCDFAKKILATVKQ